MGARFQIQYLSVCIKMILLTLHIVSIGAIVGITAHFAYSIGKKEGFQIVLREQEDKEQKNEAIKIES